MRALKRKWKLYWTCKFGFVGMSAVAGQIGGEKNFK
jgi:hypothetical protein